MFLNKENAQGSKQWLEERKNFIGASEVASVLRLPEAYETYEELLTKKILKTDGTNAPEFILNKGKNAEPVIKALYESRKRVEIKDNPIIVSALPYVRASLDGILEDRVVEFKLVGKTALARLRQDGRPPAHHYAQLQCQMWCAMMTKADYCAFDGEEIHIVEVQYDQEYVSNMINECIKFKAAWESGVLPKEKNKEVYNAEILIYLDEIEHNKLIIKNITKRNDELQEKIEAFLCGEDMKIGDYKCNYVDRKGAIDYNAYFKDKDIDLEPFRKAASKYLKITLAKK
jgi:putative phage-type endonuclease